MITENVVAYGIDRPRCVRLHEQTNWTSGTRTNKVTETRASAVRYAIQREISIKFWCIK